ncbi:MAG: hypothetical protein ACOVNL_13895 [Prochlorococcaceae cyanobacterium]|jgi:adenylate kinase family enzyme
MKLILLGNAGAGKSTLARRLLERQSAEARLTEAHPTERLSLDQVAFAGSSERLPLEESLEAARRWLEGRRSWIIEGCYADIIRPLLPLCDQLIFLNPGVEVCEAHCRARPWEPEKFPTRQEQEQHLEALLAWVRTYPIRSDDYGLASHRALFEAFTGRKCECTDPRQYEQLELPG